MEDEFYIGDVYKTGLEKIGFHVEWKRTTKETEEAIRNFKPEVILLDHGMKGEERSGLDVLRRLKKQSPACKVIMLSNYSNIELENATRKAGAARYLLKIETPPSILGEYIKDLISQ